MPLDTRKINKIIANQSRIAAMRSTAVTLHQSDGTAISLTCVFRLAVDQTGDVTHPLAFDPVEGIHAVADFPGSAVTLAQLQACLYLTIDSPVGSELMSVKYLISSIASRGMPPGGDRWLVSLDARARDIVLTLPGGSLTVTGILRPLGDQTTQSLTASGEGSRQGNHAIAEFKTNAVTLAQLQSAISLAPASPSGADSLTAEYLIDSITIKGVPGAGDRFLCGLDARARGLTLVQPDGSTIQVTGILRPLGDSISAHLSATGHDPLQGNHGFAEIPTSALALGSLQATVYLQLRAPGSGADALASEYIIDSITVKNLHAAGDRYLVGLDARARVITLTFASGATFPVTGIFRPLGDSPTTHLAPAGVDPLEGAHAFAEFSHNAVSLATLQSCLYLTPATLPAGADLLNTKHIITSISIRNLQAAGDRYICSLDARGRTITLTLKNPDGSTRTLSVFGIIRPASDLDPNFNRQVPLDNIRGADAIMILQTAALTFAQIRAVIAVSIPSPHDDDLVANRFLITSTTVKGILLAGDRFISTLERQR